MRSMMTVSAFLILAMISVANAADQEPTTMPAVEISNQPLEKVLTQIRAKVPGFAFAVFRGPDVPKDYPVLPEMVLQGTTIEQFISLINNEYPDVTIDPISRDGGGPPLYEVRIKVKQTDNLLGKQPKVVRIFRLAEIVAYRASQIKGDGDHDKPATADVLSLIQQASDIANEPGDKSDADLELHAATQTLIFKGTAAQADIVANAISALQPSHDQMVDMLKSEILRLNIQLEHPMLPATRPSK